MRFPLALLVIVPVAAVAAQTTAPRIEGHWKLDPTKTPGYVVLAGAPELTLAVQQSDSEIVLELKSRGKRVTRYPIGESTVDVVGGERTTALARWQGARLVVTGEREKADGTLMPYRLVISLSDANELVMEERQSSPNTEFVSRRVFTRIE